MEWKRIEMEVGEKYVRIGTCWEWRFERLGRKGESWGFQNPLNGPVRLSVLLGCLTKMQNSLLAEYPWVRPDSSGSRNGAVRTYSMECGAGGELAAGFSTSGATNLWNGLTLAQSSARAVQRVKFPRALPYSRGLVDLNRGPKDALVLRQLASSIKRGKDSGSLSILRSRTAECKPLVRPSKSNYSSLANLATLWSRNAFISFTALNNFAVKVVRREAKGTLYPANKRLLPVTDGSGCMGDSERKIHARWRRVGTFIPAPLTILSETSSTR